MDPAWVNVVVAILTSLGLIGLGIERWVHKREMSEEGVRERFDVEVRARLEREQQAEATRVLRERAVRQRFSQVDKDIQDHEERLNDHGRRVRDLEQRHAELAAVVRGLHS